MVSTYGGSRIVNTKLIGSFSRTTQQCTYPRCLFISISTDEYRIVIFDQRYAWRNHFGDFLRREANLLVTQMMGLHCCHRNDSLRVRSGIPGWI